jgi:hypothetical protein
MFKHKNKVTSTTIKYLPFISFSWSFSYSVEFKTTPEYPHFNYY